MSEPSTPLPLIEGINEDVVLPKSRSLPINVPSTAVKTTVEVFDCTTRPSAPEVSPATNSPVINLFDPLTL